MALAVELDGLARRVALVASELDDAHHAQRLALHDLAMEIMMCVERVLEIERERNVIITTRNGAEWRRFRIIDGKKEA